MLEIVMKFSSNLNVQQLLKTIDGNNDLIGFVVCVWIESIICIRYIKVN